MTKKIYFTLCLLMLSMVSLAQDKYKVSGTIVDQTGEPIIGATIIEKENPSVGTSTDLMGQFTIAVDSKESTLMIRYAGYKTVEYPAGSEVFNQPVVLAEDAQAIEAVTVVGYGTLRKSDLTGSVEVVSADLDDRGMVNSASELLQGKVAGLQITSGNGQPGAGSTIRIRGGSSLSASNDPLIVVDGVPLSGGPAGLSNPLGSINPNDIASFSILKDASAAAIYGSRGANGVIIITTKKGSAGGFKLTYNSDYSVGFNGATVNTLAPAEYREFLNTYYGDNSTVMALANQFPEANTDWQDHIYQAAFGTNQYVSGSGRLVGEDVTMGYRASLGYTNQQGTLKGSNYNRYTVDVGLAPRFLDDHLSVDVNFKGTLSNQDNVDSGVVGNAAFYDPTKPIYNEYADNKFNGYYAHLSDPVALIPNSNSSTNPLAILNEQYNQDKTYAMVGNVQVDYKMHFLPELRANLNLGYDASMGENTNGVNINSEQAWRDGDFPGVGRYNTWQGFRRNSLLDFYLNYANDIGKHRVDAMAGYSWQYFGIEDRNQSFENESADELDPFTSTVDITENYLVSFFGRLNYSYDSRYMVTATLRYDGSSRFSEANRWGVFPSVALGWNLAEESWLKESVVDNLKLRASWGVTGQQDLRLNDYPYQARYDVSTQFSQYQFGNNWYHLTKPLAYDENIKWEETTSWNLGLDFAAFNNRLTFNVDLYKKFTKDLLNTASVPAGTNFSNTVTTNVGDLENQGIEIEAGMDIIRNNDWRWNVTANATWQDTKITRLTATDDPNYLGILHGTISVGTGTNLLLHAVGHAPSSYYVYEQAYDVDGNAIQNTVVDRNGDGVITDGDRYVAGSIQADMYFGLSTSLSYKNWDFAVNAHGVVGNEIFNDFRMANSTTQSAYGGLGSLSNVTPFYQETGFTNVSQTAQNLSDYWLEDGSYLRIDNITVGYNFQELFGSDLSGRVSLTAQNPFIFTNYSGIDPEVSYGINGTIWARPTTYMIGLSLNF